MEKNKKKGLGIGKILLIIGIALVLLLLALVLFMGREFKDEMASISSIQELVGPEDTRSYPYI